MNFNKPDNVLFLDIDGVLFLGVSTVDGLYNSDPLNKDCVAGLNAIIEKTDCSIVITSSWQNDFTLEQLREIFAWNDIKPTAIQLSNPDGRSLVFHSKRGQEILDWLASDANVERTDNPNFRWCAVDDLDLSTQVPNFVKCDPNTGLKDRQVVSRVINILTM